MISAVFVLTRWIQIPIPNAAGYIHMGDTIIFLTAFLFGPIPAMLAGAFGSALADWVSPFAVYAPFTLVIKGAMGFVCGAIFEKTKKEVPHMIVSALAGGTIMATGYFFAEHFIYNNWKIPLLSLPINCIQAISGIVMAVVLAVKLSRYIKNQDSEKWTS